MDITGARWGLHGAEAILKLRAMAANHDLDNYWTYHLNQNSNASTLAMRVRCHADGRMTLQRGHTHIHQHEYQMAIGVVRRRTSASGYTLVPQHHAGDRPSHVGRPNLVRTRRRAADRLHSCDLRGNPAPAVRDDQTSALVVPDGDRLPASPRKCLRRRIGRTTRAHT
jgi:hypothetical protein